MIQRYLQSGLLLLAACGCVGAAAEPPHDARIRADANLVLVGATVLDRHNNQVQGLTKQDFRLSQDGVEQKIASLAEDDVPVSAVVLFDISGSMKDKIPAARQALAAVLGAANPEDEFCLVTFAERARLAAGWTRETGDILGNILFSRSDGATALLDAIQLGTQQIRRSRNPRRALIVFSDGGENYSRITERRLMSTLEEADVQVFAIDMAVPSASGSPEEMEGPGLLARLCDRAGGRYFHLERGADLAKVAAQISRELNSEYVLGFAPSPLAADGKYHRVQVKVVGPGRQKDSVYWRRGYRAPGAE